MGEGGPAEGVPLATDSSPHPNLSASANPTAICVQGQASCSAGAPYARITLTASAPASGTIAWPAVQILFVLETSPFDGVFDYLGSNESYWTFSSSSGPFCSLYSPYEMCGDLNTVEAFVANDSVFVHRLQTEFPATRLTFGLVDFFATHDQWDDSDGYAYHVDVGQFVNASDFPAAVHNSFQTHVLNGTYVLTNSSLADNMLHSSSITALYGALMGVGIGWSSTTHHVVVLIDSTVPRDPNYVANYCQSFSTHIPANVTSATDPRCYSSSCEPSYDFGGGIVSPRCEGWVMSRDGNSSDSIASLAYSAPACVNSLGGGCTIDAIEQIPRDFNTTAGAGTATQGCIQVLANNMCSKQGAAAMFQIFQTINRTIAAGCDLSIATGGSWDGTTVPPESWDYYWWLSSGYWPPPPLSCGTQNGTLWYGTVGGSGNGPIAADYWGLGPGHYFGCYNESDYQNATPPAMCDTGPERFLTSDPYLISSLGNISLGQPPYRIALAGLPDQPLFRFVPWGSFGLAPYLDLVASCHRSGGYPVECDPWALPVSTSGVTTLDFNWSTNADLNVLEPGDSWTASFNVVATGPPFDTPVPVDACTTNACLRAGSGPVGGHFTSVLYVTPTNGTPNRTSFPLVEVTVEPLPTGSSTPPSSGPPPPPSLGTAPPVPAPTPTPTPVTVPQPVGATIVAVAGFSLPAIAAGILAAGATRAALQRRATRVAVPLRTSARARSGHSQFETDRQDRGREHRWFD